MVFGADLVSQLLHVFGELELDHLDLLRAGALGLLEELWAWGHHTGFLDFSSQLLELLGNGRFKSLGFLLGALGGWGFKGDWLLRGRVLRDLGGLFGLFEPYLSHLVGTLVLLSLGLLFLSLVQLIDFSSDFLLFLHFTFKSHLFLFFFSLFLLIQLYTKNFLLFSDSLSFFFLFIPHLKTHDSCWGWFWFPSSWVWLRRRRRLLIVIVSVCWVIRFSWIHPLFVLTDLRLIVCSFFDLVL